MEKSSERPSDEAKELKPEMRDLILRFDAKDRRAQAGKSPNGSSKARRRRGDKPADPS
jgi:hypothetical protein